MMIGYKIYDYFTMEHFPLCQIMILTTFNEKKKHPHKINVNEMVVVFKLISKLVLPQMNIVTEKNAAFSCTDIHHAFF
jgi:hypothetical protein